MPTQFIFPQIKTHDKADVETSEQTWLNRQKKRWNIELVIRVLWTEMAKTAKYLELEQQTTVAIQRLPILNNEPTLK